MATGVELATAWLRLVPTTEGIQDNVADALKPAEKAAEDAGKKSGSRFSGAAKVAMLAGLAGLTAGVVNIFQTGMEELKFGEQINAQTEQLIANTGFKGTVSQINDVTLALSQLSGISEEDLQSAGNNILKFGDVSEDTYERAVSSINDLGASGKDVAGVSEALGKALADPATAAALLKRQGVLLNDEQKALIDSFTESGDKAAAQGVILDALESSYGGMAEAAGGTLQGNLNKLGNAWENLAGDIVAMAMPAVEGFTGMLQGLVGWLSENQGVIVAVAALIGVTLVAAFIAWAASIWATTIALLANPITWIILAIIALIAAIVLLVMNWDQVVAFLTEIWSGFISWITGVIEGFVAWWNSIWAAVGKWIGDVWRNIVNTIQVAWMLVSNWVMGAVNGFLGWWGVIWQTVGRVWESIWSGLGSFVRGVWSGIVGFIRGYINSIIGMINGIIDGINGVAGAVGDAIGVSLRIPRIPMLAEGGTITRSGAVIVGERGPELLNLPRGASVNPDIAGGGSMPDTLIVVDTDGQLVARMQVEAAKTGQAQSIARRTQLEMGSRR
jgi:hypothetical protein